MVEGEKALEHAWRYFQLHAQQRISVFNFFVVLSGLLVTAAITILGGKTGPTWFAAIPGLLLMGLSFLFYKLDDRVSFLIKNAETAIIELEPEGAKLLCEEPEKTTREKNKGQWSYGKSFRTMFMAMALAGLVIIVVSLWPRSSSDPRLPEDTPLSQTD